MLGTLLDFLYPTSCVVCGTSNRLSRGALFCSSCEPDSTLTTCEPIPYGLPDSVRSLTIGCRRCGEHVTVHDSKSPICVACSVWPLPIGQLRSQFWYEGSLEVAIKAMKYKGQRRLTSYFAERLADDIALPGALFNAKDSQVQCRDFWDALVPVPSSVESLTTRGFGHTAFIARKVASALNIDASVNVLKSVRPRKRQVDCSAEERFSNVLDCFGADHRRLANKRVLLIDDVLTTGATITSAAAALLDAGASSVDAITIARSRKFRSLRLIQSNCTECAEDKVVGWDD